MTSAKDASTTRSPNRTPSTRLLRRVRVGDKSALPLGWDDLAERGVLPDEMATIVITDCAILIAREHAEEFGGLDELGRAMREAGITPKDLAQKCRAAREKEAYSIDEWPSDLEGQWW